MKSSSQMMVFMSLVLVLIGHFWSSKRESCSDWSVAVAVIFDPSIVCSSVSFEVMYESFVRCR